MLFRHRACRPAIGPGHEQATDDQVSERVGHATIGFKVSLDVLLHGEGNISVTDPLA
jgi:hypothetical protein